MTATQPGPGGAPYGAPLSGILGSLSVAELGTLAYLTRDAVLTARATSVKPDGPAGIVGLIVELDRLRAEARQMFIQAFFEIGRSGVLG